MDEFDKIRELSQDIGTRKEPTLGTQSTDTDNEELYDFKAELRDKLTMSPLEAAEEKQFSSMKIKMIGAGVVAVVALAVLGGFVAFKDNGASDEMMMIEATQEPVKIRPANPGGMRIPDQDKYVYDRLRTADVNTTVESLFPEPEKPVVPDTLIEADSFVPMQHTASVDPLKEKAPATLMPTVPAEPEPIVAEEIVLPKAAPVVEPKKVASPKSGTKQAVKKAAVPAATGNWHAQLMSSSKKATVEKSWPTILAKHKGLLSNMPHKIVKADIAGKGTFYRLWVGNFANKNEATALCKKLKAQKQDCVAAK